MIADESVRGINNFVCGANKGDAHFTGANWGRDAEPSAWTDLMLARENPNPPILAAVFKMREG